MGVTGDIFEFKIQLHSEGEIKNAIFMSVSSNACIPVCF